MSIGPVQMLVLGFDDPNFDGSILAELERLREMEMIRLIDMMAVQKDEEGNLIALQMSDLTEDDRVELGAVVGALIGAGAAGEEGMEEGALLGAEAALEGDGHLIDEDEVWYIADVIPNGSAAAIALIEHRWLIPLRDAIAAAGGTALADEWIHAKDLIAIGVEAAEV
jgi:uncharacterized membrane protein